MAVKSVAARTNIAASGAASGAAVGDQIVIIA